MTVLEALQLGARYSADDPDEDRARDAGMQLDALRIILGKRKIGTVRELRDALGVKEPVQRSEQ